MKIELDTNLPGKNRISAYSAGRIYINDLCIDTSCVVTADHLLTDWQVTSVDEIRCEDFDPVIDLNPEIILLGTGGQPVIPAMEICAYIQGKSIGFEFMESGAAIRSYNILISEDRNVALALLLS